MAVDHYAPCPCGSGKKLKFCKCVEHPQDYEKLLKLIEGGQGVAAIDRINQLLQKTPNAAWLLAIKGELALSMQEMETFSDTANRFLKLKPDNPLALIMKSIVALLDHEPIQNAARLLLEGMSESRESLPALSISAIRLLIAGLAHSGATSMVGYWSEVLEVLTSNQEAGEHDSAHMDQDINLIAKSQPPLAGDKPGAAFKERLAEVQTLVRSFRHAQAETKLRSILRDFPDEAGPLSHLLRAQMAQLDQHGAVVTANKLAEHLDLPSETRAYFGALSLELEPENKQLQGESIVKFCSVDSEQRVDELLRGYDFVEPTDDDETAMAAREYYAAIVEDDVPAKCVYTVFDNSLRPQKSEADDGDSESGEPDSGGSDSSDSENETSQDTICGVVATVVLFGKQTDKPSRVLMIGHGYPPYKSRIDQLLSDLQLGESVPDVKVPVSAVYREFLNRPMAIQGGLGQQLSFAQRGEKLVEEFLNYPLALFDFKSPLEVKDDERLRGKLISLLYHLEGEQNIVVENSAINAIYDKLGIERPSADSAASDPTALRLATTLDMERIDVNALSAMQLRGLTARAMGFAATRVFYRCAMVVRGNPEFQEDVNLQVGILSGLLTLLPSADERIALTVELEEVLAGANAPVGKIVIQRMGLLHSLGRADEARETLIEGISKYPNDPFLMSFLQYAQSGQGGGGPMGPAPGGGDPLASKLLQNASRQSPAETSGGIVLPGQESGAPQGESKLWLPGS